jgi:hypothetical protein
MQLQVAPCPEASQIVRLNERVTDVGVCKQPSTRISLGECVESERPAVRPRGGAAVRKSRN